jgi:phosphoglycolate phosphatase
MLAGLKAAGKKIVLSTSKPEVFAKKILELFDIAQYFDVIGAATLDHSREKKCEVLAYALSEAGATDLSKCILVGDRMFDAEGARICGIDSLGVLYGHGSREEMSECGFVHLCESPDEVAEYLI